jgi:biopolymer transport protein ExbD
MGLKKRSKVSAEFSMSSLTDIIFLLLIFFMLTSTLVNLPQFELPESNVKTVASTSIIVGINKEGEFTLNGASTPFRSLERKLKSEVRAAETEEEATITIVAEKGTPFDNVQRIMTIASNLQTRAIIATQPKN